MKRWPLIIAAAAIAMSGLVAAPAQARSVWDYTPVVKTRSPMPAPLVVNLRYAAHRNFDRVVIELQGRWTGYRVAYTRQLVYDASGQPVPLRGRRFMEVVLTPANAHNNTGNVYQGPQLKQLGFVTLRGVAFTGDFEGYVSFGLSLSHRDVFRVIELRSPNRLVIDLHH